MVSKTTIGVLWMLSVLVMQGCESAASKACKRFAEVCTVYEQQSSQTLIITLRLGGSMDDVEALLRQKEAHPLYRLEATSQFIATLTKADFIALAQMDAIERIQVDHFHPR